jgi:hypothetical protein
MVIVYLLGIYCDSRGTIKVRGRAQGIAPTMDGFASRGGHGGNGTFLSLHLEISLSMSFANRVLKDGEPDGHCLEFESPQHQQPTGSNPQVQG